MSEPIEELRVFCNQHPAAFSEELLQRAIAAYDAKCAECDKVKASDAALLERVERMYIREKDALLQRLREAEQRIKEYEQQWIDMDRTISTCLKQLREAEAKVDSAFVNGLKRAVEIVSLRIATPKNKAFTAAIEECKVFLEAEIERGGKPAYCVCTDNPPTTQTQPTKGE